MTLVKARAHRAAYPVARQSIENEGEMRFSTVMAVLLFGAVLVFVMAVIRAVVVGRMEGMQAEAFRYRQKAVRAAWSGAAVLALAVVTGWL
jgi:hypothetical protein